MTTTIQPEIVQGQKTTIPVINSSVDTESAVYKAFKTLGAYQAPRNIPEKYKREADVSPRITYLMGEYGLSKDEAARFVFIQRYFEDFISNEKSDHLGIHQPLPPKAADLNFRPYQ